MLKVHGILMLSSALALALFCAGAVSEEDQPMLDHDLMGMGMHMEMLATHMHFEKAMQELDFSDEQRTAAIRVMEGRHGPLAEQMKSLATARADLFLAIHSETLNETVVRNASRRVAAIDEELAVLKARIAQEIHLVLTPEQRTKARAMLQGWHTRFLQNLENFGDLHEHLQDCEGHDSSVLDKIKEHFHGKKTPHGHGHECPHGNH